MEDVVEGAGASAPASQAAEATTAEGERAVALEAVAAAVPAEKQSEKWFGTQYRNASPTEGQLSLWRAAHGGGLAGGEGNETGEHQAFCDQLASALRLPPPNDFIPTDFTLRHQLSPTPSAAAVGALTPSGEFSSAAPSCPAANAIAGTRPVRCPPRLLLRSPLGHVFYKADERFGTPKAVVWLSLNRATPRPSTLRNALLACIVAEVTLDGLVEAS